MSITVVIPAFNAQETIAVAIGSAWSAGCQEVIVVDDGSNDNTGKIAKELECTLLTQENQGAAMARRRGAEAASTPYLTFLDADDRLLSPGVGASLRIAEKCTESKKQFSCIIGLTKTDTGILMPTWPEGITITSLLARATAPGPPAAMVWNLPALRAILASDPTPLNPRFAEDYEFLIRAAKYSEIVTHSEPCCIYTTSGGKSARHPLADMKAVENIRRYYAEQYGIRIRKRGAGELKAMSRFRRAFSTDSRLEKSFWYLAAAAASPWTLTGRAYRRARR
jgi:glycosyltransferase involved in cell wall biosynthesis